MRILLGVHAFPPRSTAGVEVYTLRLAQALMTLGHEVLVMTAAHDLAAEPGAVRRRVHAGVPVAEIVNLHQRGTLEATYADPDVDQAAQAIFSAFRPQVVHLQHLLNLSIGVIGAAQEHNAALLFTLHDYWLSCPRDGQRMRADQALCATMDHATCGRCLADSPYLVPGLQRGLAAFARRAGAGRALHRVHDLLPGATRAALRLMRRGTPVATGLDRAMDARAERLRAALTGVDLLLAPTRFARERALEFGLAPDAVRVLALGAVTGPTRARRAGPRPRLGFVGTLAPHKGVHVLLEAFSRVSAPHVTLDIFGSPTVEPAYVDRLRRQYATDQRIRFRGAFAEGEQARVLGEVDVLVVPSLWWENSPLTALEALAAGLPVVASHTGGVPELVVHDQTGLLVPPGDADALAAAMREVVSGQRLGEPAPPIELKTVAQGARELAGIYADVVRSTKRSSAPALPSTTPRATVVVPVLNGAAHLPALLGMLREQDLELDILAIDSSSSDRSADILEGAGVRLLRIPRPTFDHGETRNLGAREARGDFVIFLSQDALPADTAFARRLIEALERDGRLAGAFARQVPRPDADPLTKRDLASWVAAQPASRTVFLAGALADLPPLEQQRLAAFDNVASVVRRSVLLAHPFAPTRFGEDIEWSARVLGLGYGIAYVPEALVVHSHARSVRGLYRRNYLGHRTLWRLFGVRTVPDLPHLARAALGSLWSDLATLARDRGRPSAWLRAPGQALAASWGQYRGARDESRGRPYPEWA